MHAFESDEIVEPYLQSITKSGAHPAPMVLVVDDDPAFASAVSHRLRAAGLRARVTWDGLEALAHIHLGKPDMVILDLGLPGIDGLNLLRTLQTTPEEDRPGLIVVTGNVSPEVEETVRPYGVLGYFKKPAQLSDMAELIQRELRL